MSVSTVINLGSRHHSPLWLQRVLVLLDPSLDGRFVGLVDSSGLLLFGSNFRHCSFGLFTDDRNRGFNEGFEEIGHRADVNHIVIGMVHTVDTGIETRAKYVS